MGHVASHFEAAVRPVSSSQHTPVEQLFVPEHAKAAPVHIPPVLMQAGVRPLAQHTWVFESQGVVPHAI